MPQWRKNDYFDANLRRYITMMTPRRLRDVIRHPDSPHLVMVRQATVAR